MVHRIPFLAITLGLEIRNSYVHYEEEHSRVSGKRIIVRRRKWKVKARNVNSDGEIWWFLMDVELVISIESDADSSTMSERGVVANSVRPLSLMKTKK